MNKVRLLFNNVAEILGNEDIGLIVLTDELKLRQIVMVCDKATKLAINMRARKMPETEYMLPEVMARMLKAKGTDCYEILINDVKEGQYVTVIHDISNDKTFKVKASHAILLSLVSNIPVYITEELMKRQSNDFMNKGEKLSVPINAISEPMLEESLKKAIEEENYELASKLSKEINKRKNKEERLS